MGRLAGFEGPKPLVERAVRTFVRAYDVNMDEAIVPPDGFRSFDEFFTRRLKPGARPVDPDPNVILSPADGRVEDLGPIEPGATLLVKGRLYDVPDLLGDPESAARYEGGSYFVVYLSPRDYHRVHAPVTGPVEQLRHVPGTLFPVNAIGTEYVPRLFARNERVAVVQRSQLHGEVTTIMVGAIGVGRITMSFDDVVTNDGQPGGVRRYADGPVLERGEELGTFHLGSTAIVFTTPDAPLRRVVEPGAVVRMGRPLARRSEG